MKRLISTLITTVTLMLTVASCGRYTDSSRIQEEISTPTLTDMSADIKTLAAFDYKYTVQDVYNLQNFLLTRPTEEDLTGKPYDLNGDERWDVFDLCLMKREVLKNSDTTTDSDTLVVYFSRTGNTEKLLII